MYRLHSRCRACGFGDQAEEKLVKVLDLGIQPLANDFRNGTEEHAGFAPLEVLFCPKCTLAQLSVTVNSSVLYDHYSYVTSPSQTMQGHFKGLCEYINAHQPMDSVLEIGSNDGAFLSYVLKNVGQRPVQGIDPARNLVEQACKNGIPTICDVFDEDSAKDAARGTTGYHVIIARHVFCHVDDWMKFLKALRIVSRPETLVCIEVPYAGDLIGKGLFDTIYHEHTSYMTIAAMRAALATSKCGFRLYGVTELSVHGGAILIMLRREEFPPMLDGPPPPSWMWEPKETEFCGLSAWKNLRVTTMKKVDELRSFVHDLVANGKRVAGYGASAKSTVWVNACGFTNKEISFITDTTAQKQHRLSPGSDIPIVEPSVLSHDSPDYLICFAWNYFEPEILEREADFKKRGGKWIVPAPTLKIV